MTCSTLYSFLTKQWLFCCMCSLVGKNTWTTLLLLWRGWRLNDLEMDADALRLQWHPGKESGIDCNLNVADTLYAPG